ncbi:hypothetical protein DRA43_02450 [Micromonospora provocatoris]|nr:hypothetical protein DRA43_02450 [Micromonospora provocatoris]
MPFAQLSEGESSTKRMFAALAVAAAVSSAAAVPGVAQAKADSAFARCSGEIICAWSGSNFTGTFYQGPRPAGSTWCRNTPFGMKSVSNGTSVTLTFSQNKCGVSGGSSAIVYAGQDRGSFPFVINSYSYCGVCRQAHTDAPVN